MGTKRFDNLYQRRYEDILPYVHAGDIMLASGEYAVSRIIRHASNSMFSHVGFVFTWNGRILLLESVEDDGVRAVPLSHYVFNYENENEPYDGRLFLARHKTPFNDATRNQLLGTAADKLNRTYDKREILSILARMTTGLGNHTENEAYICSEFVDVCYRAAGIALKRGRDGSIFPEHIASDPNVQPLCEIILQPAR